MADSSEPAEPRTRGYNDGSLLRYYRAVNESHDRCMSYVLGNRGFFAEISTVARAMIYAWVHDLQLVLESDDFAYRAVEGWGDYFQPFCGDAAAVRPESLVERFRFDPRPERPRFMEMRGFNAGAIRFGVYEIRGQQHLIRHCMRMIFRLAGAARREVDRLRLQLGLPAEYVAVHIRRGDKVGDEDVFYPVEQYFDALGEIRRAAVFVMSDDYSAVEEVAAYLSSRRAANPILTLCRPEHTGFDVWKLRANESFAGGDRKLDSADDYRRYVWEETTRLLAETVIASQAKCFASTRLSNVGRTVWYLHDSTDACRLIG